MNEFKTFFELGAEEAKSLGQETLGPNDSERLLRFYEDMILRGNHDAIWRFHVFENNLVEEDATQLLDPLKVCQKIIKPT